MGKRPLGVEIARMLAERGVDTIFGIPGVHNIELYRGIEGAGLTHVLARHEQGAGFMADGYARATGKPGVAFVITGPGLTNIMTPMGQAYSDSVPMLVISSCLDETAATRFQLHQMRDQRAAAATVCDWSEEARTAQAAFVLIDRALTEFETSRTRPKHIQIPISVLSAPAEPPPAATRDLRRDVAGKAGVLTRTACQVRQPSVSKDQLNPLARQLMQAERPLFVFGGGAAGAGGPNGPARWVLAKCGAASFTTYAGRGIVAPDDPLSFGAMLARSDSASVLDASDCLVIVGTDLSETDLWRAAAGYGPGAHVVNLDPEILARGHPQDARYQMDARDFLVALLSSIDGTPSAGWTSDIVAGFKDRWIAEINADRPGIVPVCDALRACLPERTMIFSDMTQFAYTAKEVWEMPAPGLWHHPYGFGTLGYALPAAIGGKVGVGDRPVIAIAGDYGFQYTLQEIGTAAELGVSLPILIWDNGMLKEIEASMQSAQIAPIAVQARNPDFGKLAAAYGIGFACPDTLAALQTAVRDALSARGPTLIRMTPALST